MRRAVFVAMLLGAPASAAAFEYPTVGGHEGEIDVSAAFVGHFGLVEPTPRPTSALPADIKVFALGAGVTFGNLGPFLDFYARVDGGYFIAAAEVVERPDDDLPPGTLFYGEDKGGWVTATIGTNFVHEPRFAFGAFIQGTVPIDVELAKFSNIRVHYAGGGALLGLHITEPASLIRLTNLSRIFVGSGAYAGDRQHNAQGELESVFYLEMSRWILPWRAGLGIGPRFVGDLNDHVNLAYYETYGSVSPDLVAGERVQQLGLDGLVRAFVFITQHAVVDFGFEGQLAGQDARATRRYRAGLRVAF